MLFLLQNDSFAKLLYFNQSPPCRAIWKKAGQMNIINSRDPHLTGQEYAAAMKHCKFCTYDYICGHFADGASVGLFGRRQTQ